MSDVYEAIHGHHAELAKHLAEAVEALADRRPDADPDALVTFLQTDLLPHAQGEERHLYPAVDQLVKAHGSATATMAVDHEYIARYIEQLAETAQALSTAATGEQARLRERIARLGLQLQALLEVHLE